MRDIPDMSYLQVIGEEIADQSPEQTISPLRIDAVPLVLSGELVVGLNFGHSEYEIVISIK